MSTDPAAFDPYKTLQVDSEADPDVIQAAYRRLAQRFHPDVASEPEAVERMRAINRAWEILRDPSRRRAYDLERARAATPAPAAPAWPQASNAASASRSTAGAGRADAGRAAPAPPEDVSRNWTSGRSTVGGGYDPESMGSPQGHGAAGPPPGQATGSVLTFGRYAGWSLGEIARRDLEYLEWLDRMPIGRIYRDEVDTLLRRAGRRRAPEQEGRERHGLFRRR